MPKAELLFLACAASMAPAAAQTSADIREILDRLARIEQENRALREEVRALRTEIRELRPAAAAPASTVEERVEIHARRLEEFSQTKVEASQKFPIRLTGMALFNVHRNGPNSGGQDVSTTASAVKTRSAAGASVRQSVLGFQYHGPETFGGGKVSGSLFLDLYDGAAAAFGSPLRVRTASINLDWKTRGVSFGLEKPIFAPREPNSLAQVGISPLTSAGNLWVWLPQVRAEQKLRFSRSSQLRAQLGVVQTAEDRGTAAGSTTPFDRRRPGLEGRFQFEHALDDTRRVEVAPGFHFSRSRVLGQGVPSSLFSLDWFANPWEKLEFTGAFFDGQNVSHFGALRQGWRALPGGRAIPVHSTGGWGQFTFLALSRLTFNAYGGVHDDRNSDLAAGGIGRNLAGAANVMFRAAPNVILSFEAMQTRTSYIGIGTRHNNRYDLAVAYLF